MSSVTFAIGLVLTALTLAAPVGGAGSPDELRYSAAGDTSRIDWYGRHPFAGNVQIIFNIMEGLVQLDSEGRPAPALAERWEELDGGRRFVFHLRPDVVWSDGVALKARDFVFGWERVRDPKARGGYGFYFDVLEKTDGVRALDDRTLEVRLQRPMHHFVTMLYYYVAFPEREDFVKKRGGKPVDPTTIPSLGPYRIASSTPDKEVVLERNPRYYGPRPEIARVRVTLEKDFNSRFELAAAGKVDLVRQPPVRYVQQLTQDPRAGWRLATYSSLNVTYVGFNFKTELGGNPAFRRAIALALDPRELAKQVPDGTASQGWLPPGLPEYTPMGLTPDPVKARAAYGALEHKVSLYFYARQRETAVALRDQLTKNLSLQVRFIEVGDDSDFGSTLDTSGAEIYLSNWSADYPDAAGFFQMLTGDSGFNLMHWKNAAFDRTVRQAESLNGLPERKEAYAQAQRIALEQDVAVVPLGHRRNEVLLGPRIDVFEQFPTLPFFYIKQVRLKGSAGR